MQPTSPVRHVRRIVGHAALIVVLMAGVMASVAGSATAAENEVSGWVLDSSGAVTPFGGAADLGDSTGSGTAVSLVSNAAATGYWVLWADGSITAHGAATLLSDGNGNSDASWLKLNRPAVSLALLPGEDGYVILAADGGVFTFGAAKFHGSVPQVSAEAAAKTTAVAIHLTATGYQIIHDDGGVFAFNAPFKGSVPQVLKGAPDAPIVDSVAGPNGTYAMVGGDGGVFAFGTTFRGSIGGTGRTDIIGASSDGVGGYAIVDKAGKLYWFGASAAREVTVLGSGTAADVSISNVGPAVVGSTTTTTTTQATTTTTQATTTTTTTQKPTTTTTTQKPTTTTTTQKPTTTTTTSGGGTGGNGVSVWAPFTGTHDSGSYFQPLFKDQGNWENPNIINGDVELTLAILDKPTDKEIQLQVCFWRWKNGENFSGGFDETCTSGKLLEFTGTSSTKTYNLGSPTEWWVLGGGEFPWDKGPDVIRIMVKDKATKSLLMDTRCGSSCYTGSGSASQHTPIRMTASMTFNN